MFFSEVRFAALAFALFSGGSEAAQRCKYTICETEIDKPLNCTTREAVLQPSEMAELFFNPDHPVEGYDCKPEPKEKNK